MSAPSEFHLFPDLDKDAKLAVVKRFDLESSLSYALVDKTAVQHVRTCRIQPTHVKIDLTIHERHDVPTITMMFDDLPGYAKLFEWSFLKQKTDQDEERKYRQLPTSFSAEGVVLEDFYHNDYSIGSVVSDGDFDKTFTHVEHFLLKELFLPPEQIVVVVDEKVAAKLGHDFESRGNFHVAKLKLIGEWKDTANLKRILEGYTADELDVIENRREDVVFKLNSDTMDLMQLRYSTNLVKLHHIIFEKIGLSMLDRIQFKRMKLQGSIDSLHMFIKAWNENAEPMRDFSLLTVYCEDAAEEMDNILQGNRPELDAFSGWQPKEDCYAVSDSGELLKITNGYAVLMNPATRVWCSGQCFHFLVLGREFEAIDVEKGRGLEEQKESKLNARREAISVNRENGEEQRIRDLNAEIELTLKKIEDGEKRIDGFKAFWNLVKK